jgi:hypothetical protein
MRTQIEANRTLVGVKLLHTVAWAFFAGCIVAIPVLGCRGRLLWAAVLSGVVLIECAVLMLNHWRCPLTDVAGRYTSDRADNFDIYLPLWLARHIQGDLWRSVCCRGVIGVEPVACEWSFPVSRPLFEPVSIFLCPLSCFANLYLPHLVRQRFWSFWLD